jgi:hypothetical protein
MEPPPLRSALYRAPRAGIFDHLAQPGVKFSAILTLAGQSVHLASSRCYATLEAVGRLGPPYRDTMDPAPVNSYLQLMDSQREAALRELAALEDELLWVRPSPKEWSPGEHLSHTAVVHRFFRTLHQLLWPFASLVAKRGLHQPFHATIDDVYARPQFPHAIGRLWPPTFSPRRPASLEQLTMEIRKEHTLLRLFYTTKDEKVLGHAPLYYPSMGWINYTQSLRVAVFHDAHHFAEIREALSLVNRRSLPSA